MTLGKRIEVGLVLQGGGALGAYEWGAVTALLECMDDAQDRGDEIALKAVTGVSIGSINAACVVGSSDRGDARRRLKDLWEDLTLHSPVFLPARLQRDQAFFGLPGFYTPRVDWWAMPLWTCFYDTRALLETLARHVDFSQLNSSETSLVVTAVNVETGMLTRFRNRSVVRRAPEGRKRVAATDEVVDVEPQHILASCSLAPQFPWKTIEGEHYWDGGLVDNTPLGDAIDGFSGDSQAERLLVVMNLYPLRASLPTSLPQVLDRVHELSFGNRLRQDHESAERINGLVTTIDELARLVPQTAMSADLRERIDRALAYKVIKVINVDVQDPADTPNPAGQHPADYVDGLRDFSRKTVERRRVTGHSLASRTLRPALGLDGSDPSAEMRQEHQG